MRATIPASSRSATPVELLRLGKTVRWVMDATALPRATVTGMASAAGMVIRSDDTALDTRPRTVLPQAEALAALLEVARDVDPEIADEIHAQINEAVSALEDLAAQLKLRAHWAGVVKQLRRELAHAEEMAGLRADIAPSNEVPKQDTTRSTAGHTRSASADYPTAQIRTWARAQGLEVPARGRYLPEPIVAAWRDAHPEGAS